MSRTYKDSKKVTGHGRDRQLSVRAVRKSSPDLRKLSRALIQLAMAQAELEAQTQAAAEDTAETPGDPQPACPREANDD